MTRTLLVTVGVFVFGAGFVHAAAQQKPVKGGYVIEHDADVAKQQPGPHDDGENVDVGPGTAVLTRTGSSHGLKSVGSEDLVIIVNYPLQR